MEKDVLDASETDQNVCRCDAMHMCEVEVSTPSPPILTHMSANALWDVSAYYRVPGER